MSFLTLIAKHNLTMDTPESPPSPGVETPARTSLISRLTNMFAAPGEVFDEVKSTKTRVADWLVPVLLSCLVGIIYSIVVFSQDSIVHPIREAQEKEMQKQVDAGKMSRQQADQALQVVEQFTGPTMMKVFGSVGAVVGSFAYLFLIALALFLVGTKPSDAKRWARWIGALLAGFVAGVVAFQVMSGHPLMIRFLFFAVTIAVGGCVAFLLTLLIDRINPLGGSFTYMKAVEVSALAGVINVLGGIIAMLLAVTMGNMAMTPGPVLLVHEFNPANKLHALLSQLNVMTIWYAAVLAVGLSKVSGASFRKAALWTFGLWAILVALIVVPRWGR